MHTTPPTVPRNPAAPTLPGVATGDQLPLPIPVIQVSPATSANLQDVHALATAANIPPPPKPSALMLSPDAPPGKPVDAQARTNRSLQRWLTHRNRGDKPESSPATTTANVKLTTTTTTTAMTAPDDERLIDAGDDDKSTLVDDDGPDASFSDSDSEAKIDSIDSDSESTDEEFGKGDNPKLDPKTRADLEAMVFEGKKNTTLRYKAEWEKAKKREDDDVKLHRFKKYLWDFPAGNINQFTSFGIGGIAAAATGNPWVFPPVAALASDLIGDRLAQVIRKSTIATNATKEHFETQRRCARAIGDLIESCAGKEPKKKFLVTTGKDEKGNPLKEKMTAADALAFYGKLHALGTAGQNLLVRGLPFLWFTTIYWMRDYYLNYRCYDTFFPAPTNASHGVPPHLGNQTQTPADGCPNPVQVDIDTLRWAMIIIGGMLAGGATTVTNQLISSLMPGEERTNYTPDTWKLQVNYLESACIDTKMFLDKLATETYREELRSQGADDSKIADIEKAAHALTRIQDKELRLARKKSSYWTSIQAELDQTTQKHRDKTMITPEFGGNRLSLILSVLGKFLSVLVYAYFLEAYNFRKAASDDDRLRDVLLVPMSLIVLGYMLRDDLRLVGHLPYGVVKGIARACRTPPGEDAAPDVTTNLKDVAIDGTSPDLARALVNDDDDDDASLRRASADDKDTSPNDNDEKSADRGDGDKSGSKHDDDEQSDIV